MNMEIRKFLLVLLLFVLNIFLIPIAGHNDHKYVGYLIFTLCVVLLPLLVLTSRDVLEAINEKDHIHKGVKNVVWVFASLPTLIFGLLSLGIGVAIIGWVLYNVLIKKQPEFTGIAIFGGFGIGPSLVGFGMYSLYCLWPKTKNA